MDLRRRLAHAFAESHPEEAAAALEARPPAEAARVLSSFSTAVATMVAQKMAPGFLRQALEQFSPKDAAQIVAHLPLDAAAAVLRGVNDETREQMLAAVGADLAHNLRVLVKSPAGTAGALMDPRALAIPSDLTVEQALETLQREAQNALYNVYVVDREGVLVGVLNLQELLRASPTDQLASVVNPAHHRLDVSVDQYSLVSHPGWLEVYSLPVVDPQGRFLGAVRYRTLRRIEGELRSVSVQGVTATALGDLFRTGIVGVVDALSGMVTTSSGPDAASPTVGVREEANHEPDAEE